MGLIDAALGGLAGGGSWIAKQSDADLAAIRQADRDKEAFENERILRLMGFEHANNLQERSQQFQGAQNEADRTQRGQQHKDDVSLKKAGLVLEDKKTEGQLRYLAAQTNGQNIDNSIKQPTALQAGLIGQILSGLNTGKAYKKDANGEMLKDANGDYVLDDSAGGPLDQIKVLAAIGEMQRPAKAPSSNEQSNMLRLKYQNELAGIYQFVDKKGGMGKLTEKERAFVNERIKDYQDRINSMRGGNNVDELAEILKTDK